MASQFASITIMATPVVSLTKGWSLAATASEADLARYIIRVSFTQERMTYLTGNTGLFTASSDRGAPRRVLQTIISKKNLIFWGN
jgi:hypothetical protein